MLLLLLLAGSLLLLLALAGRAILVPRRLTAALSWLLLLLLLLLLHVLAVGALLARTALTGPMLLRRASRLISMVRARLLAMGLRLSTLLLPFDLLLGRQVLLVVAILLWVV